MEWNHSNWTLQHLLAEPPTAPTQGHCYLMKCVYNNSQRTNEASHYRLRCTMHTDCDLLQQLGASVMVFI